MDTTPPSLLLRVRDPSDHAAWREFDARYRELLIRYCRHRGIPYFEAEDIVQVVFAGLLRTLPRFTYQRERGGFRGYLYRCVSHAIFDWSQRPERRRNRVGNGGEQPFSSPNADKDPAAEALWQREWENHHIRLAMETVRRTFDEKSAAIFERSISGATVAELAREFGMSEEAVYKARQRIRDRTTELIAKQIREEEALGDEDAT